MMFILCLIALCVVAVAADMKFQKLDLAKAKHNMRLNGIDPSFIHVEDVMNAVSTNKLSFQVHESRTVDEIQSHVSKFNLEDGSQGKVPELGLIHDTYMSYELKTSNYFSLDDRMTVDTIHEMTEGTMLQCHDHVGSLSQMQKPIVGDVFVFSEKGLKSHIESKAMKKDVMKFVQQPHIARNKGFALIRKVVSVSYTSRDAHECIHYTTEDLHPLEVIESFTMKSNFSQPYSTRYFSANEAAVAARMSNSHSSKTSRSLATTRYGILTCDDAWWNAFSYQKGTATVPGLGGTVGWTLGTTFGCAD